MVAPCILWRIVSLFRQLIASAVQGAKETVGTGTQNSEHTNMPVKKGRLRPDDDKRITKNYAYLLQNLDPDDFTDILISSNVLTIDDRDSIKNESPTTRAGRAERFLGLLVRAGEEAYDKFIEALRESGNEAFAKRLQETDLSGVCAEGPFSWINHLPDDMKSQKITDQHASRISAALGNNWQAVFAELGVPQVKVQQMQMTHQYSIPLTITNLLITWRQREAGRATIKALLEALKKADGRCTIDWDVVRGVVQEKS